MSPEKENLYAGLKRIFHEPSRLAILSALSAAAGGLTFNELKEECGLTFGNLSSHLKTLQDAGVIDVKKYFVGNKPQTTISLTDSGRAQFVEYLKALEEVLKQAAEAISNREEKVSEPLFSVSPARA
ncbi:MAG: transcriptional regulator [bacterium]